VSGATDPAQGWDELFALTGGDSDMQQTLHGVVQYAKRTLPGTDEAAITLIRRGAAATVATTGGMAEVLDELQYETGYGPCLDAGRANEILHIADAATETRWPRYLPPARKNGLASSLSLPIPVENYLVGALNLYSRTPAAFTAESVELGDVMAAHICAALSRAEAIFGYRNQVEQLRRAMDSRAVIEQAKGMVMAQRRCSAVEAFTELRTMSMNQNIKLAELAASIVSGASGHPVRFDDDGQ
jgi:GAF domain-containing protein